jgi:hypothetical protein
VVNCAGPFADTALPLARAALAAGAHYLDIAAEQPSTLALLHSWSTRAERAGVVVMPGVGFFGGLGDLLVTAVAGSDGSPWDHVAVEIELSGWHPSDGTLATGDRNPGARLRLSEGLLVTTDGDPLLPGRVELRLSETLLVPRHLPVRTLQTTVNASAVDDLERGRTQTREQRAAARDARSDSFRMRVVARRGEERRSGTVEGDDFYAITGPLVAEVAALVVAGEVPPVARAPGELPDPTGLLRRLPLSTVQLPVDDG